MLRLSALSLILFVIIMDVIAEEAVTKPAWAMLFADDLVLVSETVEEVAEERERRRAVTYAGREEMVEK